MVTFTQTKFTEGHVYRCQIYTMPSLHTPRLNNAKFTQAIFTQGQIYTGPHLHKAIFTQGQVYTSQIYPGPNLHKPNLHKPNLHRGNFTTAVFTQRQALSSTRFALCANLSSTPFSSRSTSQAEPGVALEGLWFKK